MQHKHLFRAALVLVLATTLMYSGQVPTLAQAPPTSDQKARLDVIKRAIEEKRQQLGVPGLSLVIVKDDAVIYQEGHGFRDDERKLPVTPDTLFAIGSCTKAFTAMAAVMSADEGKLSLDDSPRKYLPYFKLQDAEADAKVTIRDLLSHRTGLDNTDIAWFTGVLNRKEVIQVAGLAKPTAKPGQKFQYQNVMFSAAGEVVSKAQDSSWEEIIDDRFFKPLGMKTSNTSVKETLRVLDHATGYTLEDKKATRVPMRDLTNIAPAGAINSNARDMAQWARLMLGGGMFDGKRLVSEKGFNELVTKQISTDEGGINGYGLGWGILDWHGHKVLAHSGGIDGFHSLVALMPDQKIGFVLLTNVSRSALPGIALQTIWSNLVEGSEQTAKAAVKPSAPPADSKSEAGTYVNSGLTIDVVVKDNKLVAVVPGQPEYALINVAGRKYKLSSPAPDGFFMTFRPAKEKESETEMFLEQPQGNVVLIRKRAASVASASSDVAGPFKELLGRYEKDGIAIEITAQSGKAVLVVPAQPAYTLVEKEKDTYGAGELPDSYRISVKRDSGGKVSGILVKQPEGEFEFKRVADSAAPRDNASGISVDELMAKVVEAAGGEANLRKHSSMVESATEELQSQGLTAESVTTARAPNEISSTTTLMALGKKIGTIREYFDGTNGGQETSFSPAERYRDSQIADAKIASDFNQLLNWKTLFKTVKIKTKTKLGDEEVWVVVKSPEKGSPVTEYISTSSFLVLKRDLSKIGDAGEGSVPATETYSDYRKVDGVMIPFTTVTDQEGLGTVVSHVKEVKFDIPVRDAEFRSRVKSRH